MTRSAQRLRRFFRNAALMATPAAYGLLAAAPAWAATGSEIGVAWIGVTDSAGVPVGSYGLSIDNGSLTDPGTGAGALIVHWLYGAFLTTIGLALWLVDNVMSFQWLRIIAAPFDFIGREISRITLSPAVIIAVGTIAAVFIAVNVVRGNVSKAGAQIGTAAILAMVAVVLANKPISELVGPNGVLAQGRDVGIELSSELSGKPQSGPQAVQDTTNTLADHFARVPTLVWNFGADLDSAPYNCGSVWSTAITAGDLDKVKDAVRTGCPNGDALHEHAMRAASDQLTAGFLAVVFALAVLIVFGYLCYQVVILALSALFWAIVAVVAAVTGWVPGPTQGLAIKAALDAIFSWLGMAAYVAIVGITGALSAAMFALCGNDVMAMPLVTTLLVALFLALRRVRGGLVSIRERAARAVSAFSGHDAATAAAAASGSPSHLDRLDPLIAVPHLTGRTASLTRRVATTAAKAGITAAAPEAAPFLEAGSLSSTMLRRDLRAHRKANASNTTSAASSPPSANGFPQPAPTRSSPAPAATAQQSSAPPPATPVSPQPPSGYRAAPAAPQPPAAAPQPASASTRTAGPTPPTRPSTHIRELTAPPPTGPPAPQPYPASTAGPAAPNAAPRSASAAQAQPTAASQHRRPQPPPQSSPGDSPARAPLHPAILAICRGDAPAPPATTPQRSGI